MKSFKIWMPFSVDHHPTYNEDVLAHLVHDFATRGLRWDAYSCDIYITHVRNFVARPFVLERAP